MDDETKSGRLTHQLGRPHAWKGGIAGHPYLETVSLTIANMCQAIVAKCLVCVPK